MDSLRLSLRPIWIWIRYIQYATTGTTLCHPQNWLCRCDALFRSRHLALISPLGHQTHKTHGDAKVYFLQRQTRLSLNYGEHHPSHVQRYALPSKLSHNSISSPYSLPSYETCSTNANYIFHVVNKNYSLKTHFDYRHLTSSLFLY